MAWGAGADPPVGILRPDWPAPARVGAAMTTRRGGASRGPYAEFNLGDHVGDDPRAVSANRARLTEALGLPEAPRWLHQCHGAGVVRLTEAGAEAGAEAAGLDADAAWTERPGVVCAVLTADCLPVLLCDRRGARVAAVHAGWRGLAAGVLESAVRSLTRSPAELLAWLGPAIGPESFEIGDEVRERLLAGDPRSHDAFQPAGPGRWRADLCALARARLETAGVRAVYGGTTDTLRDPRRFYSYRRDGATGRMAALIWIRDRAQS